MMMKVLKISESDYREAVKQLEAAEEFAKDVNDGKISTYGAADVRYSLRWVRTLLDHAEEPAVKS